MLVPPEHPSTTRMHRWESTMPHTTPLAWFKSSHSGREGGNCVEVATHPAAVHIRDSRSPTAPSSPSPTAWTAFLAATTL
ncbi:DUF397 domain-containing protein [Streptomyces sp. NPDC056061]|uniref:DUF397 domain-containing protein n=1 Tax=Streptomyces sp. NPDC056061 TaxID=3345700 RepID=UPI0035DC735E